MAVRVYEISDQNRIVSVSENWDRFARGNGGDGALSGSIMGRPLWDFVAGLEARAYLNALLFAVRSAGRKVAVRYRCDGLSDLRHYQMQIEPLASKGLRLVHLPLDVVPRRRAPVPPPPGYCCCALCLRAQADGAWQEGAVFHGLSAGPVDFSICPGCRAEAQRAIDGVLSQRA